MNHNRFSLTHNNELNNNELNLTGTGRFSKVADCYTSLMLITKQICWYSKKIYI